MVSLRLNIYLPYEKTIPFLDKFLGKISLPILATHKNKHISYAYYNQKLEPTIQIQRTPNYKANIGNMHQNSL
jgi:hypothetical protein